jgi:hypothetical protein
MRILRISRIGSGFKDGARARSFCILELLLESHRELSRGGAVRRSQRALMASVASLKRIVNEILNRAVSGYGQSFSFAR